MRNSLRLAVLLGGASLVAGAAFLVACSDDTSVSTTTDSGLDSGGDGSKTDGNVEDGGADTAPPFDGGFVVDTFDSVIATELCKSLARCCYGTATPAPDGGADGGTFDMPECLNKFGRLGFEGSNADSPLKDGGKVTLDQLSSDTCIKKIQAMACDLPGADFKAIRSACFGAYTGTVAAGGACTGSIECQQGLFCKTNGDAGTGVCTALRGLNGACGDFNTERADEACSYRAGGSTGNYCKIADLGVGVVLDAGDWKCTAASPAGSDCNTSLWCDQSICTQDSKCQTPERYFDSACGFFAK